MFMITVFYNTGCYYLALNELCIEFLLWLAMTHSIVGMAATITTDADVWPKHNPHHNVYTSKLECFARRCFWWCNIL